MPTDLDLAAQTLYYEARGETEQGKAAVMWVIRHRAEQSGKSLSAVVKEPKQFSAWNEPEKLKPPSNPAERMAMAQSYAIAAGVMSGQIPDPTGGADHYFNPQMAQPVWALSMQRTVTIGRHDFYRGSYGKRR